MIIKDKDGFEMARLSKFDDEHADNITDDTLIGEFADGGLYRADINTDERYHFRMDIHMREKFWLIMMEMLSAKSTVQDMLQQVTMEMDTKICQENL